MTQPMQRSGPSKAGLWIGSILIVVGIVGGIGLVALGAKAVVDTVNDFQRVDVSTGGTVSFSKTGRYDAYYEHPGIDRRADLPDIQVELSGPGGRQTLESDITRTNSTEHYDFGDHEGVRLTRFTVSQPGQYQVRILGEPVNSSADRIAFGRGSITRGLLGVIGGVLGGGLVAFIGLIVLITTAVRRGRYRRRMAQAAYAGGYGPQGGYGAPGSWPPAGPGPPGQWPPAGQPGPPGQPPGQPDQPPGWAPPPQQQPPASAPTWPPPQQQPPQQQPPAWAPPEQPPAQQQPPAWPPPEQPPAQQQPPPSQGRPPQGSSEQAPAGPTPATWPPPAPPDAPNSPEGSGSADDPDRPGWGGPHQ